MDPDRSLGVAAAAELHAQVEAALAGGGLQAALVEQPEDLPEVLDCAVVHVSLGTRSDALSELLAQHPGWERVVVCSPPAGARGVRKAIEQGADGLVWESRIQETLVVTISSVLLGQVCVPRDVWRRIERPELTTREKQTLGLVVMGLSNGEIAGRLFVSESTVKSHLSAAFRKLGVKSRAEASRVITDPREGLGTGILEITGTSSSGRTNLSAALPQDV